MVLLCNFYLFKDIVETIQCFFVIGGVIIAVITFIKSIGIQKKKNDLIDMNLYLKIKKDFYSANSRELSRAIANDKIRFEKDKLSLFRTDDHTELKRDLLDHIEDLAFIRSKDKMTIDSIYEGYGDAILLLGNCPAIQQYISAIREKRKDNNLYKGFEGLVEEMEKKISTITPQ